MAELRVDRPKVPGRVRRKKKRREACDSPESCGLKSDARFYLEQARRFPLLTAREERELAWKIINDGCAESRDRMIRSNLRLVVCLAKQYRDRGLPLADLIEEGNVGLIRAVDGYDPALGTRFSTYASWWIRQCMLRALGAAARPVHVPAYMIELVGRWKRATRTLENQCGRAPTQSEVAAALNISVRKAAVIARVVHSHQTCAASSPADPEPASFDEMIVDQRSCCPIDDLERAEEIRLIRDWLDAVDRRDAQILRMRFGMDPGPSSTLKRIGAEVGLSRERVRQIGDEALRRLSHHVVGVAE